jgi:peptide/nickel transport system substrate-binding protein
MKKLLVTFLVFLLCSFTVAACANPSPALEKQPGKTSPVQATSGPKYGGVVRVISDTPAAGVIGWPAQMFSTIGVSYALEGLVREQLNGDLTPLLADSWTVAPDKMSLTFNLKKGIKFHDGTDFNAQAVKFAEEALMTAKMRPFFKSIEVIDDYTVKFNLTEWRLTVLPTFESCDYVSPTAFDKNGLDWAKANPVGTGPYKFKSFTRDVNLVFAKNENYWQKGKPYLDGLEVKYIVDPMTQKAAMQVGDADVLPVDMGKPVADMKAMGKFEVTNQVQTIFTLLPDSANADSPFANKKVREAVEYAIDREEIAKGMGYGMLNAPNQIIPRSNIAYDTSYTGRKYDPAKARQLLTEAGYPGGFKTTITPAANALNKDVWVAVQSYLGAVGIQVELQFIDFAKYSAIRSGATWQGLLGEPIVAWGNFDRVLSYWFSPKSAGYKSVNKNLPEWVAAFDASDTALKMDVNLIRKAAMVLQDNALAIPVYEAGRTYAYTPNIKDAGFNTRGIPMYWNSENIWIDK